MNIAHGSVKFCTGRSQNSSNHRSILLKGGAIWEKITGSCATTHSVIWQKETLPYWKRSTTD